MHALVPDSGPALSVVRLLALVLALALLPGCSLLLELADGCHARRVYGVGGSFPVDFCVGGEADANRMTRAWGQYLHVYEAVLAEEGLTPLGGLVDQISGFEMTKRADGGPLAGQWDTVARAGHLWVDGVPTHWINTAGPHEMQHAYESLALGQSWSDWRANEAHFALGDLGFRLFEVASARWLATAWTCGDGGLDPPESFGKCEPR